MSLSEAWSERTDQQAIDDAVTAERGRCAKIAEEYDVPECGGLYCGCPESIAAAIRSGK